MLQLRLYLQSQKLNVLQPATDSTLLKIVMCSCLVGEVHTPGVVGPGVLQEGGVDEAGHPGAALPQRALVPAQRPVVATRENLSAVLKSDSRSGKFCSRVTDSLETYVACEDNDGVVVHARILEGRHHLPYG